MEQNPDDDSYESNIDINNLPLQELPLAGSIENVIMEIFGSEKDWPLSTSQSEIIYRLTCASPKRSVFLFFDIVEETHDAIDRAVYDDKIDQESMNSGCQNVWSNHSSCLEYLSHIEAFRDFIIPCREFIENLVNHDTRDDKKLNFLNERSPKYLAIRSEVEEYSQSADLTDLVMNLKDEDWLAEWVKTPGERE